jgi:hypothetical protein
MRYDGAMVDGCMDRTVIATVFVKSDCIPAFFDRRFLIRSGIMSGDIFLPARAIVAYYLRVFSTLGQGTQLAS